MAEQPPPRLNNFGKVLYLSTDNAQEQHTHDASALYSHSLAVLSAVSDSLVPNVINILLCCITQEKS